jgi:hypothetical protein
LVALYIAQFLLSGWLHVDLYCGQCAKQVGPAITAACDGNGPCSLPTHHHHPDPHRHQHLGCSLCSPLLSSPVETPCFVSTSLGVVRTQLEVETSQLEPSVLGSSCPRGPPSLPSAI